MHPTNIGGGGFAKENFTVTSTNNKFANDKDYLNVAGDEMYEFKSYN